MITLSSTRPLFDETTPFSKEDFVPPILEHMKKTVLGGVMDSDIEATSQDEDSSVIMVKTVDPFASTGYLAFQSAQEYDGWLKAALYEPTQDEIEEALNRGDGA